MVFPLDRSPAVLPRNYDDRFEYLTGTASCGLNGSYILYNITLTNDGVNGSLDGSRGRDLFFASYRDTLRIGSQTKCRSMCRKWGIPLLGIQWNRRRPIGSAAWRF